MKTTRASRSAALGFFVCAVAAASPVKAEEDDGGAGYLVGIAILCCGPPLGLLLAGLLAAGSRRSASRTQHTVGVVSGSMLTLALLALAAVDLYGIAFSFRSLQSSFLWVTTGAVGVMKHLNA